MTKIEIISKISERTGVEKTTALVVVESLMLEIKESIRQNMNRIFKRIWNIFSKRKKKKKLVEIFRKTQLLLYLHIIFLL